MLFENLLQLLYILVVLFVLRHNIYNIHEIFQCNCQVSLLEFSIVVLTHCTIYEMLNLPPIVFYFSLRIYLTKQIALSLLYSILSKCLLTSNSISNLLISSVAVFKFSNSIYSKHSRGSHRRKKKSRKRNAQ